MIFAFDIDNTICKGIEKSNDSKACSKAKPIKRIIKIIQDLKTKGHQILIFSHRKSSTKSATIEWLKKNQVPFDQLVLDKPKYDLLIDDKTYLPFHYINAKFLEMQAEVLAKYDFGR